MAFLQHALQQHQVRSQEQQQQQRQQETQGAPPPPQHQPPPHPPRHQGYQGYQMLQSAVPHRSMPFPPQSQAEDASFQGRLHPSAEQTASILTHLQQFNQQQRIMQQMQFVDGGAGGAGGRVGKQAVDGSSSSSSANEPDSRALPAPAAVVGTGGGNHTPMAAQGGFPLLLIQQMQMQQMQLQLQRQMQEKIGAQRSGNTSDAQGSGSHGNDGRGNGGAGAGNDRGGRDGGGGGSSGSGGRGGGGRGGGIQFGWPSGATFSGIAGHVMGSGAVRTGETGGGGGGGGSSSADSSRNTDTGQADEYGRIGHSLPPKVSGQWQPWVLTLGTKKRNEAIRHYSISTVEAEDMKRAARRMKQNLAQVRYLRRKDKIAGKIKRRPGRPRKSEVAARLAEEAAAKEVAGANSTPIL